MSKQKTIEEIQKEIDYLNYINERLRKLSYYEWDLLDKMRYGKLLKMKENRIQKERI
jgi:hypothetical protein